jgi:hypothetical protein
LPSQNSFDLLVKIIVVPSQVIISDYDFWCRAADRYVSNHAWRSMFDEGQRDIDPQDRPPRPLPTISPLGIALRPSPPRPDACFPITTENRLSVLKVGIRRAAFQHGRRGRGQFESSSALCVLGYVSPVLSDPGKKLLGHRVLGFSGAAFCLLRLCPILLRFGGTTHAGHSTFGA